MKLTGGRPVNYKARQFFFSHIVHLIKLVTAMVIAPDWQATGNIAVPVKFMPGGAAGFKT
jgi:hypothetical protein